MDGEAIETIRETSRNLLVLNRRKHRDEVADVRRSMTTLRVKSDTITHISNKLKTKSTVSLGELQMLKNALIDDVANIEVVLHTHGALRGLVREMTGHEVNKQCAAAGCCCNLSLGDSRAGVAVAKAAGPYLMAALDNLASELAVTSAWTLGNLAGSGPKACELLMAQGSLAKLTHMLSLNNEETKDGVFYALLHFAYQLKDDLKTEHLHKLLQVIPVLKVCTSARLLFILSCHQDFTHRFLTETFLITILDYLYINIGKSIDNSSIVYLFRFLANLNSKQLFEIILSYFFSKNMVGAIKKFILTDINNESVLWLLGNAHNYCSNHVLFEKLLS